MPLQRSPIRVCVEQRRRFAAVLFFYLIYMGLDDDTATAYYHGFTVVAYFTPFLGAYLADGFLGKFWWRHASHVDHTQLRPPRCRVILWLSLLYASGSILLAVASMFHRHSDVHM